MANDPLTDEEYDARAMLLGRYYAPWAHAFINPDRTDKVWLDRDTLEALSEQEKWDRTVKDVIRW